MKEWADRFEKKKKESNTNNNYQCDLVNKKPSDNHNQQVKFPDFETVEEPEFNNNESSNTAHSTQSIQIYSY